MKSTATCRGCGKKYIISFLGWQNHDICKECFDKGSVAVYSVHQNQPVLYAGADGPISILRILAFVNLVCGIFLGLFMFLMIFFASPNYPIAIYIALGVGFVLEGLLGWAFLNVVCVIADNIVVVRAFIEQKEMKNP